MYFLGLNTTIYSTNLHGIQIMVASVERSCFIKHIFTIYGLSIKKNHDSKQKKKLSSVLLLCHHANRKKKINQKKKKRDIC